MNPEQRIKDLATQAIEDTWTTAAPAERSEAIANLLVVRDGREEVRPDFLPPNDPAADRSDNWIVRTDYRDIETGKTKRVKFEIAINQYHLDHEART